MQPKRIFKDQLKNEVEINFPPKRIVSLVPSQTEYLFDIGLENELKGITRFCIHPKDKVANTTKIGGTKTVDLEAVRALKPDLIIGNKEENELADIEALRAEFPVWMSDISTLDHAYEMMKMLGKVCDREHNANALIERLKASFSEMQVNGNKQTVAYFIWRKPYMVAASVTFIDNMLQLAGFINAFGHLERYPKVTLQDLKQANPDIVMLSSEPYSYKPMHIAEFAEVCPQAIINIVDGELFSWYGSRLLHTAAYLQNELPLLLKQTKPAQHI